MMPRLTIKRVALIILGAYFLITCYTGYEVIRKKIEIDHGSDRKGGTKLDNGPEDHDWNPWGQDFESEGLQQPEFERPQVTWQKQASKENPQPKRGDHVIEIWGKAAIGLYLWEHILKGELKSMLGGVWSFGVKRLDSIIFRFRTGPGVVPAKVPQDVENLVLVLNGREQSKVDFSIMWLEYLRNLPSLRNVAIVMLGNEQCDNHWLHRFLEKNGGIVKAVFLVYDSPEIDNHVYYQWPLGVATYRSFPHVQRWDVGTEKERSYVCNFLGTIYKNTSREILLRVIQENHLQEHCLSKPRLTWLPSETDSTREVYIRALAQSDLTLNPVGKNPECYRIYEAMSFGSVPVVEDLLTPGHCSNSSVMGVSAPLRLLKKYDAPLMYIKDWRDLPQIIEQEQEKSLDEVIARRQNILLWYDNFKTKMKQFFIKVLKQKFFTEKGR